MSNTERLSATGSAFWGRGLPFALGVVPTCPLPQESLVGSGFGVLGYEMGVPVQNSVKSVWEFVVPASSCELKGSGSATEGVGGGGKAWESKAALRAASTTSVPSPKMCRSWSSSGKLQMTSMA
jgi:hypothetical protein